MSMELTPETLARHAVLYVDDNDWSRAVFARTVESFVSVELAESPERALEMLRTRPYSIVVTDLRMPDMDGIELCVRVREQFPKVRRILVTAYGDLRTATDAINRGGISHFITKPWKTDFLVHAIKEILTRVELERTVESLQEDLRKREMETSLAERFARILHDLSSIPLPIRTALLDLRHVLTDQTLSASSRSLVDQQCRTLGLVIDHIETILRRSKQDALAPAERRCFHVWTALETARSMVFRQDDRTTIELECADPQLQFLADLTDVTRVLVNLIRNAQAAVCDQADGRIVVKAYRAGNGVAIEVLDNGPGVRSEIRDRIFEHGFSGRREHGGLGLGLSISRDLTVTNGGSLTVEDGESGGGRFVIRLPAPGPERATA